MLLIFNCYEISGGEYGFDNGSLVEGESFRSLEVRFYNRVLAPEKDAFFS
jgi:hypothetical protein